MESAADSIAEEELIAKSRESGSKLCKKIKGKFQKNITTEITNK